MIVHPPSTPGPERYAGSLLRSGWSAAPGKVCLPLLPSGPDGVRKFPLRRTRPSTPLAGAPYSRPESLSWELGPAIADCGYRAPLAPRLARSRYKYSTPPRPPRRPGFGAGWLRRNPRPTGHRPTPPRSASHRPAPATGFKPGRRGRGGRPPCIIRGEKEAG